MGFFDTVKEQAQELRGRVEHKVEDVQAGARPRTTSNSSDASCSRSVRIAPSRGQTQRSTAWSVS
jgi:hypothetical protein